MLAQNNVTHIFVGSNTALVTTQAPSTARTMGIKRLGEQLCDATALGAGDGFQVLYADKAGKLQVSPVLYWNDLVSKRKLAATSDAAQVVAIGYNGTSGAIETNNGGEYLVTIGWKDGTKMFNKRQYKYGQYTADASATQYEIVNGIQTSFLATLRKDPFVMFKMEKLNSGTSVATSGGALTVTNGSRIVTTVESSESAADAAKYSSDASTIVAGDIIRFGHATTKTYPVYKVVSITGGGTASATIVLDQPYQGTSGSVAAANAGVIAATSEGDYGLTITAMDSNKPFELGKWEFNPLRFDVGLSVDFGATPTTVITSPAKGVGTYKEIATIEWELVGNRREAFRIAEYPVDINSSLGATSGETYTTYVLQFKDRSTQVIGGTAESFITLMIASAGTNLGNNLDTVFTL